MPLRSHLGAGHVAALFIALSLALPACAASDVVPDDAAVLDAARLDSAPMTDAAQHDANDGARFDGATVDPHAAACEGFNYRGLLAAGLSVSGDLPLGESQAHCGAREYFLFGQRSAEHAYALEVSTPSRIHVRLDEGTNFPGVLYTRRERCDSPVNEQGCAIDEHGADGPRAADLLVDAVQPGVYFVFVDGLAAATGHYVLSAEVSPLVPIGGNCIYGGDDTSASGRCLAGDCELIACGTTRGRCVPTVDIFAGENRCGDLVVESGEDCDGTPGCGDNCLARDAYCDDALSLPHNGWIDGTIDGAAASRTRSILDGLGPEHLYRLVIDEPSFVRLTIEGASANVRTSCADPATQIRDSFYGPPEWGAEAGEYFVVVEACGDASYRLKADVHPLRAIGDACDMSFADASRVCGSSYCIDKDPEPVCAAESWFPALCLATEGLPSIHPGVILGSTRGRPNDNNAANCGGVRSGDVSYRLVVPEASHVRVSVAPNGTSPLAHPLLAFMPDCSATDSARACAMPSNMEAAVVDYHHAPAGVYRVTVDGVDGSEGDFRLLVEVDADIPLGENCDVVWQLNARPFGGINGAPECAEGFCLEGPDSGWVCKLPCAFLGC
ncbi:MAG: hypothetical protein IPK60_20245 [Sandaracinaceae bacterium]|nr:hypothetical protein [Sandaracinaceae bacterium]